jgi:hypothetical protein
MARRWCEADGCEERALPDTIPPKCKMHSIAEGKCTHPTKFGNPCNYNAEEGSDLCVIHRKHVDGEFHLTNAKDCQHDGYCTKKAARGKDFCADHIVDPEERKVERKRMRVEKTTGSERMRQLLMGEITVADLDDRELLMGQFKDKNGEFTGRPPSMIPKIIHQKMTAELFRRADGRMTARLFDVVDTMVDIATDEEYEPKDRIKAAQFVYERLRGKTPEILQIQQERPFEIIMTKIEAGPRTRRRELENVEEAEIVEESE